MGGEHNIDLCSTPGEWGTAFAGYARNMGRFADSWRSHLLTTFSGNSDGRPHWVGQIEQGDDAGFFTDAFLQCHTIWDGDIPGGADTYVREWAKAGELVGVRTRRAPPGNCASGSTRSSMPGS